MKHMLIWLLVPCLFVAAQAIVCTPNFCDNVKCDAQITEANCCGSFRPTGGICGCCPLCVTIIPEGGKCISPGLFRGGPPPTAECVPGTICNNGTCQAFQLPLE